jgi:hypothetical protein
MGEESGEDEQGGRSRMRRAGREEPGEESREG